MTTAGDEVEVEGLGVLRNRIVELPAQSHRRRCIFKPDPVNTR